MRAARLVAPGRFVVEEHPTPEPGEGEVLLAVDGCGLCASNLGPWHGIGGTGFPLEPGAPGHETYGRVVALGPGVAPEVAERLPVGRAVTALSYRAYADHDVADAAMVVPLPPELAGRPVLGEPMACAVNVVRRAGVATGDTVVVVGIGFLGALLLPLLARAEPARIVAVSRRRESLEVAGSLGADEVLGYDDDVAGRIAELTGDRLADVVIEATGKQPPLDLAAELTRVRGRLVIAGYHQDGPRPINLQLWNWRGLDVVNAHERDPAIYASGMRDAVERMAAGELPADELITHRFPLDEIGEAFRSADERPTGFFKAVVVPEEGG